MIKPQTSKRGRKGGIKTMKPMTGKTTGDGLEQTKEKAKPKQVVKKDANPKKGKGGKGKKTDYLAELEMEENFQGDYEEHVSEIDADTILTKMTLPTLVSSVSSEEACTSAPQRSITPIRFEQSDSAAAVVTVMPPQKTDSAPAKPDYSTHLQAIAKALAESNKIAWEHVRELRRGNDIRSNKVRVMEQRNEIEEVRVGVEESLRDGGYRGSFRGGNRTGGARGGRGRGETGGRGQHLDY